MRIPCDEGFRCPYRVTNIYGDWMCCHPITIINGKGFNEDGTEYHGGREFVMLKDMDRCPIMDYKE